MIDSCNSQGISGGIILGIDASRNRSGGARSHIIGLLGGCDPVSHGIREIHLWSYQSLLDEVPDQKWLIKHHPVYLKKSLFFQLFWQRFMLSKEAARAGCQIMLNTDAGSISTFYPSVTMSRNMLPFESIESARYGWSLARIRLIFLRSLHARALSRAQGVIFLTNYASTVISRFCNDIINVRVIPHGVGENFRNVFKVKKVIQFKKKLIRVLYISNVAWYKHQWKVVEAIDLLRKAGYPAQLTLVGGGHGAPQKRLDDAIKKANYMAGFIDLCGHITQADLPRYFEASDIFVFASSCENMPNTLIEAMSTGIPIACSNRGPMPEILLDGGEYFDPENTQSIFEAIKRFLDDPNLAINKAKRSSELSRQYSWSRCREETCSFIVDSYTEVVNQQKICI